MKIQILIYIQVKINFIMVMELLKLKFNIHRYLISLYLISLGLNF